MPTNVLQGEGKRFTFEYTWLTPQDECWCLKDNGKSFLCIGDYRKMSKNDLVDLCDLLNELNDAKSNPTVSLNAPPTPNPRFT